MQGFSREKIQQLKIEHESSKFWIIELWFTQMVHTLFQSSSPWKVDDRWFTQLNWTSIMAESLSELLLNHQLWLSLLLSEWVTYLEYEILDTIHQIKRLLQDTESTQKVAPSYNPHVDNSAPSVIQPILQTPSLLSTSVPHTGSELHVHDSPAIPTYSTWNVITVRLVGYEFQPFK